MVEETQLRLFDQEPIIKEIGLDSSLWRGSFNGRESTLQQLSPYVGKMKSGMAHALIGLYSRPGDIVLDPFSGSGVVSLEAALMQREAWANDLSPYAYVLTRGKLETPTSKDIALRRADDVLEEVELKAPLEDIEKVPDWVREFFHPVTLREIIVAFRLLRERKDYFLLSCLLGILHHQRPGFLSYPASHLVPYLRISKFPPAKFPKMYEYRDLRSRLIAKVTRAYKRPLLPPKWEKRKYKVWQENSMALPIDDGVIHAIISSPPYFGALDYARDNRLRLWFLGCEEWKTLDAELTANSKVYIPQMSVCMKEMFRVLKTGGYCVLVLGDVERDGKIRRTAEILADMADEVTDGGFILETIYDDRVPDERRTRRRTKTTKFERIVVMQKK
jgi:SAM-dependent methyltransferase